VHGTASLPGVQVATDQNFQDLARLRAWLAPTIARSARRPTLARAQVVQTTAGRFEAQVYPSTTLSQDRTPVYAVQLTGTTFVCPCGIPNKQTGPALRLTWNPAIHYVSIVNSGPAIDLSELGDIYELDVGHPTQPAPSGPTCGQRRGDATTITAIRRLEHPLASTPEFYTSPGNAVPGLNAANALHATSGFLAARVKATLANLTGTPNSLLPGTRLVWIFSVTNVEVVPSIGLPGCGSAAVVVDASTAKSLLELEGGPNF
jgi:hypothetical protein